MHKLPDDRNFWICEREKVTYYEMVSLNNNKVISIHIDSFAISVVIQLLVYLIIQNAP